MLCSKCGGDTALKVITPRTVFYYCMRCQSEFSRCRETGVVRIYHNGILFTRLAGRLKDSLRNRRLARQGKAQ